MTCNMRYQLDPAAEAPSLMTWRWHPAPTGVVIEAVLPDGLGSVLVDRDALENERTFTPPSVRVSFRRDKLNIELARHTSRRNTWLLPDSMGIFLVLSWADLTVYPPGVWLNPGWTYQPPPAEPTF